MMAAQLSTVACATLLLDVDGRLAAGSTLSMLPFRTSECQASVDLVDKGGIRILRRPFQGPVFASVQLSDSL